VEDIRFEGDASNYKTGIEVVTAKSLTINRILQWYESGSRSTTVPISPSQLINIVNCTAVNISEIYIERSPHQYLFNISGSQAVSISHVDDKYSRRGGVMISGASKSIRLTQWASSSNILSSYKDINVAIASPAISDVVYSGFSLRDSTGVERNLSITSTDPNSVKEFAQYKQTFQIAGSGALNVNSINMLGTINAITTLTLPPIENNLGKEITIYNRNTSAYNYLLSPPAKDMNGADFSIIKPNSVVTLECANASGWRITNEYTESGNDVIAAGDANYNATKANLTIFFPGLTANRILTLPPASGYKGKKIVVFNGNTGASSLTTSVTMIGLGFSTDTIPNRSSMSLVSDNVNWPSSGLRTQKSQGSNQSVQSLTRQSVSKRISSTR
jgi:hypothetical protein